MIEVESNLHLQFPSKWHRLLLGVPLVRAQENQTVQVLLPAVHAHPVADTMKIKITGTGHGIRFSA